MFDRKGRQDRAAGNRQEVLRFLTYRMSDAEIATKSAPSAELKEKTDDGI